MKYNLHAVISYRQLAGVATVCFLLAVGAFFMINVPMPAWAHLGSATTVVIFAIPAFWASRRWLGLSDALILFAIVGVLALIIETSAIITGFPYGHFGYSDLLGFRLFGHTPWTVALAWTPLVLAAHTIARRTSATPAVRIALVAAVLVAFDLVIDPGAVKLGFWRYETGGGFYGAPLSNFVGWLISGAAAAAVLEVFTAIRKPLLPAPVQITVSALFIIFFWTTISVFGGMTAPTLVGTAILVLLLAFYVRSHYAFDDMIVYVDEDNHPTGTGPKLAGHDGDTRRHRAFSVFLFNQKSELLLQQRAFTKKTWPGVWSNSCCGHVMLHETVERAAARRLKYELGLTNTKLHVVLPDFRYWAEKNGVMENEICPVLVGFVIAQPIPNEAEVHEVRWVDWNDFIIAVKGAENGFSPWAVNEVQLLAKNELFEKLMRSNAGACSPELLANNI